MKSSELEDVVLKFFRFVVIISNVFSFISTLFFSCWKEKLIAMCLQVLDVKNGIHVRLR